jgi:hypothetical protein
MYVKLLRITFAIGLNISLPSKKTIFNNKNAHFFMSENTSK